MRFLAIALLLAPLSASEGDNQLVRDLLRELIEINTTHSTGSTGKAAEAMAARLRAAGFPPEDVQVIGPRPERANLVARLHGTGARRPLLLISHLDVVEARREDWTTDPFQFVEKDGYFYGRGTMDIKCGDAILIANLIRWKRENYKPDREVYVSAYYYLDLKPEEVMMCAAHASDLRAARSNGLRTGFIHRPNEYGNGPVGVPDQAKPGDFDVVSVSIIDLAQQMGA